MAKDRLSGKLAVILHADVAGSTALVQQDEQLAHERIQDAFQRFSRNIEKYHGLVHELRGDALLAEFERASDAVAATLAFQADQAYNNSRLPDDLQPKVRVGISLGEVVIADNTVTGAGVVLAQRVEQLADAGGLCITAALHEALPRRMPFELEDLGEQTLKGFDDPVHVYKVELSQGALIPTPAQEYKPASSAKSGRLKIVLAVILVGVVAGIIYWLLPLEVKEEPASVERMAFPLPDKPSIAVLPFTNMSGDAEQEYFADGMTDDLITDLSKISGLLVIARNSVFTYKDKQVKVQQVAEELRVRYVLEGSVRRVSDQVRINVQLVDATTGGHLWAERYDESIVDIFALQDKVTRRIVATLKVKLTPEEQGIAGGGDTNNVAAYDAFLKGWTHLLRKTPEDTVMAIPLFEQALELDPNYSSAYGALAQIYWDYSNNEKFNTVVDPPTGGSHAASGYQTHLNAWKFLQSLKKSQGKPSSQAHTLTARMLQRQRRFDEAREEAKHAIALGPNNPAAYDALIENLIYAGEAEEALRLIEESSPLDPNSPGEKLFLKGMAYYTLGRLEEAVSIIDKARSHNRNQTRYAAIQAVVLAELDRLREAEVALTEYLSGWSTFAYPDLNLIMFYWPFKHLEMQKRLAYSFTKAGLQIPNNRYYLAAEHDRLTGDQIKSLLSNKVMLGGDRGYFTFCASYECGNELEITRDQDLQITNQGKVKYFRKGGRSHIENNLLCDPWYGLGDYCVAIYRNPDGNRDAKNEYLFFTLMSHFTFSVFEPAS